MKKVKNVDRDHERRLLALQKTQEEDKHIAQLIEFNIDLVGNVTCHVMWSCDHPVLCRWSVPVWWSAVRWPALSPGRTSLHSSRMLRPGGTLSLWRYIS